MKLIKYGEPGIGKIECEGPEKFIRFSFDLFRSRGHGHYAELYDDDGKLVATASYGVRQTF